MIEKKKAHKPLPRQFVLTICQSDLDMLESAISQLASREPKWRTGIRKFATACQMERTLRVLDSIKQTEANRQMNLEMNT